MPYKSLSVRTEIIEKIRRLCAERNAQTPSEKPLTVNVWANRTLEENADKELKK